MYYANGNYVCIEHATFSYAETKAKKAIANANLHKIHLVTNEIIEKKNKGK